MQRYFGPYTVKEEISPVTYAVQPLDNPRNKTPESVHVSRMKPYFISPEEERLQEVTDEEEP